MSGKIKDNRYKRAVKYRVSHAYAVYLTSSMRAENYCRRATGAEDSASWEADFFRQRTSTLSFSMGEKPRR